MNTRNYRIAREVSEGLTVDLQNPQQFKAVFEIVNLWSPADMSLDLWLRLWEWKSHFREEFLINHLFEKQIAKHFSNLRTDLQIFIADLLAYERHPF